MTTNRTVIALAGLVAAEKAQLAAQLANHYSAQGVPVLLVDQGQRVAVDPEWVFQASLRRLGAPDPDQLPAVLGESAAQVVVIALAETLPPDTLFAALEALDGVRLWTLALIDLRTCDCFPHMRHLLESSADQVVYVPYDLGAVVAGLTAAGVGVQPR